MITASSLFLCHKKNSLQNYFYTFTINRQVQNEKYQYQVITYSKIEF
ncbi:hypothetical protein HMPREF9265_1553 [Limosilactobacillus oris PB013-T2-3]|uniref:Uncharacterized protein n=1 Tax=Limosilactobacillus oris PB013-T2-3 TaxID=908339 RepID=E3C9F0_9LACO|nr:hypothetical protein HMPREF9265_1553 [Limosilactobacillus oris PB013-T2-3]